MTLDFLSNMGNRAADMVMTFFNYGFKAQAAPRHGTRRRKAREAASARARDALYSNIPDNARPSRQVTRAQARAEVKKFLAAKRKLDAKDRLQAWRKGAAAPTLAGRSARPVMQDEAA